MWDSINQSETVVQTWFIFSIKNLKWSLSNKNVYIFVNSFQLKSQFKNWGFCTKVCQEWMEHVTGKILISQSLIQQWNDDIVAI